MRVISFALPEESRLFLASLGVPKARARLAQFQGKLDGESLLIVHTGLGPAAAGHCARSILTELTEKPDAWIGCGFAGGIDPVLKTGTLVMDDRSGIAHSMPKDFRRGCIASSETPVETVAAKNALFEQSGALAVDMETQAMRAACEVAHVPFVALRAVSDPAGDPLPVPFEIWFDAEKQRPKPFHLLWHLLFHPGVVLSFVRFVRGVRLAEIRLAEGIPILLKQTRQDRITG